LFEEAAEITRYRMRQDEALRKLKRTEQDLQRLADITGELDRQVRSLKYQAGKASRYHRLHQRLRQLELVRIGAQKEELERRLEAEGREKVQAEEMKTSLMSQLQRAREELSAAQSRVEQARQQLVEVEANRSRIRSEIRRVDDQLSHNRQMEEELRKQADRMAELEKNLLAELTQMETKLESGREELERLERELADLEAEEALLAAQEKEGAQVYQAAADRAHEAASQVAETVHAMEAAGYGIEGLGKQIEALRGRESRLKTEIEDLDTEISEFDAKFSEGRSRHDEAKMELGALESDRNQLQGRIQDLDSQIETRRIECDRLHREKSRLHHRLESLEELQSQRRGHGEGVQQAFEKRAQGVAPYDRIRSLAIEGARVEAGYEDAIESALSLWLESAICPTLEDAVRILEAIKQDEGGRLFCLPLDLVTKKRSFQWPVESSGVPDWAKASGARLGTEIVHLEEEVRELLKPVLCRTLVVESLECLSRLAEPLRKDWIAVSRSGEIVAYPGLLMGGGVQTTGHLKRKSEIEALGAELEMVAGDWKQYEDDLSNLKEERKRLDGELRAKDESIHALVVRIAAKQEELQGLAQMRGKAESNRNRVREELQTLAREAEKLSGLKSERERALDELSIRIEGQRGQALERKEEAQSLEAALSDLRSKYARHRENLVAYQKDRERCKAEIDQWIDRANGIEGRIFDLRQEEEERNRKIEECGLAKLHAEEALKEFIEKLDRVEKDFSEIEANVGREDEKRRGCEEQVGQIRETIETQTERIRTLEMESHRGQIERENLERRLAEELQSDWETCRAAREEGEEVPESLEELSEAIADIREKIGSMGEVNPLALEEYKEQGERLEFLISQTDDLEKAKASLHRTIAEVKRTARKQFLDVFEKIRQNFNQTYRKVFGGGRADLILLDEADVLSSGIEIVAQPPGKKLQSITLLSGGEKSMTAIALLFAVYRVKASPFCFLDEVDAALDDANVDRFARLLTDYRKDSQFIIVTHNKHTMAVADRLYGVTMERPGISTIMAIEFKERGHYDLTPLPEPEDDPLPERDYDAALREAEEILGDLSEEGEEAELEEEALEESELVEAD
jgi:chromosome segregation protein